MLIYFVDFWSSGERGIFEVFFFDGFFRVGTYLFWVYRVVFLLDSCFWVVVLGSVLGRFWYLI